MLGREKIEPQRGSATQTITRVDCLVSKARDRARAEFFASRARGGARSPCLTRGGGLPKWITQPKAFAQPSAARHLPTRRPRAPARPPRAGGKVAARLSSPRSSCSSSCASSSSSLFARPRSSFGRAHESSWSRFARARRASAGRELASLRFVLIVQQAFTGALVGVVSPRDPPSDVRQSWRLLRPPSARLHSSHRRATSVRRVWGVEDASNAANVGQ